MNQTIFNFLFSFSHQAAWLDALTVFIAEDLIWFWVIALLALAVVFFRRQRTLEAVFFSASAAVISWSVSQLIKLVLASQRPFVDLPLGSTLLTYGSGNDAFPSSHASFLFALALGLYFYNRSLGVGSLLIAVAVSLARITTGLHWPVDVAAGFLLATGVTLLLRYWALQYLRPRSFR